MSEVQILRWIVGAVIWISFGWRYAEMLFDTEKQPRKPLQIVINSALLISTLTWFFYLGILAGKP
jgi:hypothetical protein